MKSKRGRLVQEHELVVTESDIITEGSSSFIKLKGVFAEADAVNLNRRVYPKKIVTREVQKFQGTINSGKAFGKSYHPGFWDWGGGGAKDVAMRVLSLEMDGNLVSGTLKLLDTTEGKNLQAMVDDKKGSVGISSRGWGSSKREDWKNPKTGKTHKNISVIQDDFELETFDIVLTPSVTKARLKVAEELDSLRMRAEEGILEDNSVFDFDLEEGKASVHVGIRAVNETISPVSATYPNGSTYKYDSVSGNWYEGERVEISEEIDEQEDIKVMDRKKLKEEFPDTYAAIIGEGFDQGVASVKPALEAKDADIATKTKEIAESNEKMTKVTTELTESKKTLDVTNAKYKELDEKLKVSELDKTKAEVKAFVDKKVSESRFKSVIKAEDTAEIYTCENIETATKSFEKFETFLTRITKQVSESLDGTGKGVIPIPDAVDEGDKAKAEQAEKDEQRRLAGI